MYTLCHRPIECSLIVYGSECSYRSAMIVIAILTTRFGVNITAVFPTNVEIRQLATATTSVKLVYRP